jgi:hypothetical protein
MKKTPIRRNSHSPAAPHGALRLSHETIRTLRAADLVRAVSGCDTTSYTTDQHTNGASAVQCATSKCV